jgi:hypothetical protein
MEEHTPPDPPLARPRPPTRTGTRPSTPHLHTQLTGTTPPTTASPLPTTPVSMKMHLQALLDAKERQLQQAGMLGQRVLVQQTELEERIRQLELEFEGEGEEGDEGRREKVRELGEVIAKWELENEELSRVFGESVGLSASSLVFFPCVFFEDARFFLLFPFFF